MPLLTIRDLQTPLTRKEVEESIYRTLYALDVPTSTWKPGAVGRALITAFSVVIAALSHLVAAIAKAAFLDTAEGVWLTLVAKWVFGVDRIRATYATGEVTLTNTGGGLYILEPEDLIFRNTRTDKTYVNVEPVEIQPMKAGIRVKVRAQELGSASNANPGEIAELVTTLSGVTCTNEASVLGFDQESDEELRERCRERPSALSPFGPVAAYKYWAKTAERDGVNLGIRRVKVERVSDRGEVLVTVARATGEISADDLAFLKSFLEERVVPYGVRMYLQAATHRDVSVKCTLWVDSSREDAEIKAAVAKAIDAFMRTIDIGGEKAVPLYADPETVPGFVFHDALVTAIRVALPGEIVTAAVTAPATDLELGAHEIPRFDGLELEIRRVPQKPDDSLPLV